MSPKTPRPGTNADHNRFARRDTPPKPFAVPVLIDEDEATGKFDGEQLRELREAREPNERMGHIEGRIDAVVKTQGEQRVELGKEISNVETRFTTELGNFKTHVSSELGKVNAALGSFAGEMKGLTTVVENALKRDHVTFTAKVEVDKAEKLADTDVKKAKGLDTVEAGKDKRKFWLQIGGALLGGGAVVTAGKALLHWLGVL